MSSSENITVVIPTYNSESLVVQRVGEFQHHNFGNIVVCDDASTDGSVSALQQKFGKSIAIVAGKKNLGPAGNRNRCMPHVDGDDSDALLLFVDADCQLIYQDDLATLINDTFAQPETGVVGFGILDKDEQPLRWNYGDLMHPVHEAGDKVLEDMMDAGQITKEQFILGAPRRAASYRMLPEDELIPVGWVAEACFAMRAPLFKQLGGFATAMRYHETHDLNARVHEAGYQVLMRTEPVVKHLAFDSRFEQRAEDDRNGALHYYQKHWGMSEEVFRRLFDE